MRAFPPPLSPYLSPNKSFVYCLVHGRQTETKIFVFSICLATQNSFEKCTFSPCLCVNNCTLFVFFDSCRVAKTGFFLLRKPRMRCSITLRQGCHRQDGEKEEEYIFRFASPPPFPIQKFSSLTHFSCVCFPLFFHDTSISS